VVLLALIGAGLYVSFDDAPEAAPGLGELSRYLTSYAEGEPEEFYKFRDDFQWLSSNSTNTSTGENVVNSGTNETIAANTACVSCNYSFSGGGSNTYSGAYTCTDCIWQITGDFSFYGGGVGNIILAATQLAITAKAYFDIEVAFQAVSLALSSGGSMECGYGTTWTDGDITLNSGKLRLSRSSALTSRPLHSFSRVLGFVTGSGTNEFGCDGLAKLQMIQTQMAFRLILALAQRIFRVTSVSAALLTTLCGGNDGDLSIGSGAAVQVDTTNCSNSNQTWTDTGVVGTSVSQAVGQLDLASGGYLQLLAITSSSLAMYASGLGSFAGNFEVDSDTSGALSSRNILVAKVDNSSVSCPTTSCSVTDCPSSYTCSCSWTLTQGTTVTSNYYCVASYSQTASSSDDSNNGLWALFALFALPLVGIAGLLLMKMAAKKPAAPPVVAKEPEPVYPQYPTVETYTVQQSYPIASVEYPVEMPLSYPAAMDMTYAPVTSPITPAY
jgi:hypothetical protein